MIRLLAPGSKKSIILIKLIILILLLRSGIVLAQGPNGEPSDAPTQSVCPGIPQPYAVYPGNMANTFEWTITGIDGIDWTINSGQGTPNLVVTWANPTVPASFTITFTETTAAPASCSSVQTLAVTVQPAPVLTVTNPVAVCEPGTVDLTNSLVTAGSTLPPGTVLSYWMDAGASIPLLNPSAVATSGTYYIQASTASIPSCFDIKPVIVTILPQPVAAIQYPGTPYCATGIANVLLTGQTGGTYSSSAGLSIDPVSGDINLESSTPGTYSVTYTFSNGSCSSSATTEITIIGIQSASISYPGSPYCATGTASVLLTGPSGGTFSAGTGLVIDPATGEINLSASIPGTYTVTYSISNGSCSVSSNTTITILSLPSASLNYPGNPFCAIGTASVNLTGQSAGVFSSTTGLVIDPATGEINLGLSIAGTYTVTYTYTDGTCSNESTTDVTINPLPSASISYAGSPYCATGTAAVTLTGQPGGSFSSTAGLAIHPVSGEIDLSGSFPGTYTVAYSFSDGTCNSVAYTQVILLAVPVVSLDPVGPVCQNDGLVTLTGTPAGGTFSGPGVTGNQFDPVAAGTGIHVVTYTYGNGSCSNTASGTITVNPAPATSAIWHN